MYLYFLVHKSKRRALTLSIVFFCFRMSIAGVRIIYLSISALMTFPIFFNIYSQNSAQIQAGDSSTGYSQPRKILETKYDDSESNESSKSVTLNSDKRFDITKGILTKVLYKRGFLQSQARICPDKGKDVKLVIIITSAPNHEESRNDIRNTWGQFALSQNISLGFLLGFTPNETVNKIISNEQKIHGDIIQGQSFDSYDNLTLKTISALEWVDTQCSNAQFVLKTDDDVFINIERLLFFISELDPSIDAIYGRLAKNWKPLRNKKSKYYTSIQQYKPEVFPTFTTGPAYVFPARISYKLFEAALSKIYFKLEDVFTTGLVAESLGINRRLVLGFLNKRINFTPCNLKRHISLHPLRKKEQSKLWKMVNEEGKCKS